MKLEYFYTKSDIIKETIPIIKKLNLDYKLIYKNTNTSYSPDEKGIPSGDTGSDIERILAFNDAGIKDPLKYHKSWKEVLENAIRIEEDYQKSLK